MSQIKALREIVVIIGGLELGGTETHLLNTLPQIKKQGFKVRIMTFRSKGFLAPQFEAAGIPVEAFCSNEVLEKLDNLKSWIKKICSRLYYTFALSRKLKSLDPNQSLLHFFLPQAYIIGMFSVFLSGYSGPKIMSRRSLNCYQKKHFLFNLIERKLHTKTNFCLGNSEAVIRDLISEGLSLDKTLCIYNGINVEKYNQLARKGAFAKNVRENLGLPEGTLIFIILANLISYKGHSDLLKALSRIKSSLDKSLHQEWRLLCVGRDDGIGELLKQLAADLNISKNVLFLGSRTDIPELLNASDIGILASHEEGFSNAILEGMASALPMVVTDVGGNKEAVVSGETGFVVPKQDPEKLGEAILELALDPAKREEFGRAGLKRVQEKFSIERCVENYSLLYKKF